jgi:hypothetical protein
MKHAPLLVSVLWSVALLVPLLARGGQLPFSLALGLFALCGLVALGLTLRASQLRWIARQPVPPALVAAVPLAALVLGPLSWALLRFPWLSDVTTAEAAPRFMWLTPTEAEGQPVYSEQKLRSLRRAYPALKPIRLSMSVNKAFGHALIAAGHLPGWSAKKFEFSGDRIEGTARSPLFRQETQLLITVRKQGSQAVIDVRSRSNLPVGDFGENVRLIQHFEKQLTKTRMCRPPTDFAAKRTS